MCTEGGYNEKAPSSGRKVQCGGVLSELVGVKHADRASHAGDVLDRTQRALDSHLIFCFIQRLLKGRVHRNHISSPSYYIDMETVLHREVKRSIPQGG